MCFYLSLGFWSEHLLQWPCHSPGYKGSGYIRPVTREKILDSLTHIHICCSIAQSLTLSHSYSFTHSLTHPLTHSLTHSLTHMYTWTGWVEDCQTEHQYTEPCIRRYHHQMKSDREWSRTPEASCPQHSGQLSSRAEEERSRQRNRNSLPSPSPLSRTTTQSRQATHTFCGVGSPGASVPGGDYDG